MRGCCATAARTRHGLEEPAARWRRPSQVHRRHAVSRRTPVSAGCRSIAGGAVQARLGAMPVAVAHSPHRTGSRCRTGLNRSLQHRRSPRRRRCRTGYRRRSYTGCCCIRTWSPLLRGATRTPRLVSGLGVPKRARAQAVVVGSAGCGSNGSRRKWQAGASARERYSMLANATPVGYRRLWCCD